LVISLLPSRFSLAERETFGDEREKREARFSLREKEATPKVKEITQGKGNY
jgi:hypothetical protein